MGKTKKKKKKKRMGAVEKLWKTGRYWEWFDVLEEKNLREQYTTEWNEAWKILARRSLRGPEKLREFWQNLDGFKNLPDFPDVKFLVILRDFIEGKNIKEEISKLSGLSLPAKEMQKRVLSWQEEIVPEKKIKRFLDAMIHKPEKVSQKTYNDLAELLDFSSVSDPLFVLGDTINPIRRLNHKNTIKTGFRYLNMSKLQELDLKISEASQQFSDSLGQILLYPFLYQINCFFGWLTDKGNMGPVTRAVSSFPFLLNMVAKEKTEEIANHMMLFDLEPLSQNDPRFLVKKIENSDFEEKVIFLGKMKYLIRDDPDTFTDLFRSLYQDILMEITERRESLLPREKRELARVMEPVLLNDLDFLSEYLDDTAEILTQAAKAGCMGKKLSVLSLIVAERMKDNHLKRLAEEALHNLPSIGEGDIFGVLNRFEDIYLPHIGALKPLVHSYQAEIPITSQIADKVMQQIEFYLMSISLAGSGGGLFSILADFSAGESKKELTILRRELKAFDKYEPFSRVIEYLGCFPKNCFSEEAFRCFVTKTYEKTRTLDFLIDRLDATSKRPPPISEFLEEFPFIPKADPFWMQQDQICLLFIREHLDDFKTAPLKTIERLVSILFQKNPTEEILQDIFVRLGNILNKRINAGEGDAEPIRDKITDFLIRSKSRRKRRRGE